jgi:hypothetical protein
LVQVGLVRVFTRYATLPLPRALILLVLLVVHALLVAGLLLILLLLAGLLTATLLLLTGLAILLVRILVLLGHSADSIVKVADNVQTVDWLLERAVPAHPRFGSAVRQRNR